jgi:hypothetical protein
MDNAQEEVEVLAKISFEVYQYPEDLVPWPKRTH